MVNKFTLNNKPNDSVVAGTQLGISVNPSTGAVLKSPYSSIFSSPLYSVVQASGSGGVTLKTSGGTPVAQWGGGGSPTFAVSNNLQVSGDLTVNSFDLTPEEGTWTPVFVGSTTAGTNSYQTQEGRYTKIGDVCILEGEIFLDGTTGALDSAGSIEIHGLPFDIAGNEAGGVVASYSSLSITAGEALYMQASAQGSGEIRIQRGGASSAYRLTESEMTDSSRLQFSVTYKVN